MDQTDGSGLEQPEKFVLKDKKSDEIRKTLERGDNLTLNAKLLQAGQTGTQSNIQDVVLSQKTQQCVFNFQFYTRVN